MMLNLHRNMQRMDNLSNQFSSTKRINFPSDDPILAARALKFRTSLRETEQYQRNVGQGLSWMDMTDQAFRSITTIVYDMRLNFNRSINAENQLQERQAIMAAVNQLKQQLGTAMNTTYAGRYVFSGFRTNHPPVFDTNQPDLSFRINQSFTFRDMQTTHVAWRDYPLSPANPLTIHEGVRILSLPYAGGITDFALPAGSPFTARALTPPVTAADMEALLRDDPPGLLPNEVVLNPTTGEIFVGTNVANFLQDGGRLDLAYTRTGFSRGDLNPRIYFNSHEISEATLSSTGIAQNMNPQAIRDLLQNPNGLNITISGALDGALTILEGHLTTLSTLRAIPNPAAADLAAIDTLVNTTIPAARAALVPLIDADVAPAAMGDLLIANLGALTSAEMRALGIQHYFNDIGSTTDQRLEFEFSMNTRIPINTLARDVFTAQMYADLRELARFIDSLERMLTPTQIVRDIVRAENSEADEDTIRQLIAEWETEERATLNYAMQNRFNNMLGRIDVHFQQVSRQDSDLGARMQRLDLIRDRLVEDRLNFRALISENEDADLVEVATALSMAQAAYEASLRVGSNILQLTLADFIR